MDHIILANKCKPFLLKVFRKIATIHVVLAIKIAKISFGSQISFFSSFCNRILEIHRMVFFSGLFFSLPFLKYKVRLLPHFLSGFFFILVFFNTFSASNSFGFTNPIDSTLPYFVLDMGVSKF